MREDLAQTVPAERIKINYASLPENPEKLVFKGNRNLLHAAFYNILDNALKFSEKPVECTVEVAENGFTIAIFNKDSLCTRDD